MALDGRRELRRQPGRSARGGRPATVVLVGMNHSTSHSRARNLLTLLGTVAVLTIAVVGAALSVSDGADAADGETLRIFEKARSIQLTKADGRVLRRLPIAEPRPGDVVDVVFDLYRGDHVRHGRTRLGSDHLRCEFGAGGPPECVSHATIGRSMLVVEGTPPRVAFGTGRFAGASGRVVSAKEVRAVPPTQLAHNDIDVVLRLTRR
jgi:hypothetical protein